MLMFVREAAEESARKLITGHAPPETELLIRLAGLVAQERCSPDSLTAKDYEEVLSTHDSRTLGPAERRKSWQLLRSTAEEFVAGVWDQIEASARAKLEDLDQITAAWLKEQGHSTRQSSSA